MCRFSFYVGCTCMHSILLSIGFLNKHIYSLTIATHLSCLYFTTHMCKCALLHVHVHNTTRNNTWYHILMAKNMLVFTLSINSGIVNTHTCHTGGTVLGLFPQIINTNFWWVKLCYQLNVTRGQKTLLLMEADAAILHWQYYYIINFSFYSQWKATFALWYMVYISVRLSQFHLSKKDI